ncbi:MAG TPA: HDIG domain-containing protein, partial [bacterium]
MKNPIGQFLRRKNRWVFPLARSEAPERTWLRWVIAGVLAVSLFILFPQGRSSNFADLKEGSISTKRIVAPFNFEILKTDEEYQRDRDMAAAEVHPLFLADQGKSADVIRILNEWLRETARARESAAGDPVKRAALGDSLVQKFPLPGIAVPDWELLLNSSDVTPREFAFFQESLIRNVRDLLAVGILGLEKSKIRVPGKKVLILFDGEEALRPIESFYDLPEARVKILDMLRRHFSERRVLFQFGAGLANAYLAPNLVYDEVLNQQRLNEATARVPLSSGFVVENEKIVDQNERITPDIRKKLVSLAAKMAEKGMKSSGIERIFPLLGKFAFVAALLFLFAVVIRMEKATFLQQTKSVFLMAIVLFLVCITAYFLRRWDVPETLVPVAVGSMLFATLFDERIGFAGTVIMAVLVGGIWVNGFNLTVVSIFVGVVGVLVIKHVRNRSQILRAAVLMSAAYVFAITFTGFVSYIQPKAVIRQWWPGALMGLFTPIVSYGLLAVIESVFDVTTDFALLELSNLNHPLLKRLSVEASGTYHHSILVGNLAEAAAQAVGANSLLARVGSYYHDVGKLDKAEYFVENQPKGQNPHKRLAPRMSALILASHVKRGVELAEEYRLPSTIHDIISQHHGRTLMSLFYQKALAKNGEEAVQEEDYRYPGPRPRTREAAIVMLADAVEAASRSLKMPNHSRLKGLIEHLVDERFKAGELDRAPVTLRD